MHSSYFFIDFIIFTLLMKKIYNLLVLSLFLCKAQAQTPNYSSIHQEQSLYYQQFKNFSDTQFDSVNGKSNIYAAKTSTPCNLTKKVLGWHPYWNGTTYTNYQWSLLSDLVYFDYTASPTTGANTNASFAWSTASVVTVAKANNTKIHICVTMFSGHSTFWASSTAQTTLINNLVSLLNTRGGNGINIDFEGMGSTDNAPFVTFITNLNTALNTANPNYQLSICLYAVDWGTSFNVPALTAQVDFFTIMGYDYYYSNSATAGPTAPLYNFETTYNYTLGKSISYYNKQGAPSSKLVMGLPYYGREWEVSSTSVPAATTGSFNASRTLLSIANNTTNYNASTKFWEGNCYSPYYKYTSGISQRQCWIDDAYSLGRKYDMVLQRGLGGIAIWALGYDDGLTTYWDLIRDKFSTCAPLVCNDSIYDMGGPTRNYYNDERYQFTLSAPTGSVVRLQFKSFSLEQGYDSLWLYNGNSIASPLIGGYTGTVSPGTITSAGNALTVRYKSDGATVSFGYKAVHACIPAITTSVNEFVKQESNLFYPNPAHSNEEIRLESEYVIKEVKLVDITGKIIRIVPVMEQNGKQSLKLPYLTTGLYLLQIPNKKPLKLIVEE
jgi:spore germination protein YaaH